MAIEIPNRKNMRRAVTRTLKKNGGEASGSLIFCAGFAGIWAEIILLTILLDRKCGK